MAFARIGDGNFCRSPLLSSPPLLPKQDVCGGGAGGNGDRKCTVYAPDTPETAQREEGR